MLRRVRFPGRQGLLRLLHLRDDEPAPARRFTGEPMHRRHRQYARPQQRAGRRLRRLRPLPAVADHYAFQMMYNDDGAGQKDAEAVPDTTTFTMAHAESHPHRALRGRSEDAPLLWRYFVQPSDKSLPASEIEDATTTSWSQRGDAHQHRRIDGAFVFSSGKNMGVFKGVGFPEDIADFFRLDEYEGYIWTAHGRFPTNTQALVGRRPPLQHPRLDRGAQRRDLLLRHQPPLPGDVRLPLHHAHRHRGHRLRGRPAGAPARPLHRGYGQGAGARRCGSEIDRMPPRASGNWRHGPAPGLRPACC